MTVTDLVLKYRVRDGHVRIEVSHRQLTRRVDSHYTRFYLSLPMPAQGELAALRVRNLYTQKPTVANYL